MFSQSNKSLLFNSLKSMTVYLMVSVCDVTYRPEGSFCKIGHRVRIVLCEHWQ